MSVLVITPTYNERNNLTPLVEGVLCWLDESDLGRVGLLDVRGAADEQAFGVLALFREDGRVDPVAVDATGRVRPDWAEKLLARPLRSRRVRAETWTARTEWPRLVRSLARHFDGRGTPLAVAAFRIGP